MNKEITKRILILFTLTLFFIPAASAITYPTLNGYVTDNANIIIPEYASTSDGMAVRYTLPEGHQYVNKIRLYGSRYGDVTKNFDIEIWDSNLNTLYSRSYSYNTYFPTTHYIEDDFNFSWIDIDVPDIKVKDEFYVAFFSYSGPPPWRTAHDVPTGGIHIGITNSGNQRSYLVTKSPNAILSWKFSFSRESVDFMIRTITDRNPSQTTQNHADTVRTTPIIPTPIYTPVQTIQISDSETHISIYGEKTNVVINEDILLRLSAVNLINKPVMTVQVILYPPSGMSVTGQEFVKSGAGIYTTTYKLDPGDSKDIEIKIRPNQIGDFDVKGVIVYYFGDDKSSAETITKILPIKVSENKEDIKDIQQIPGFGIIMSMIILLTIRFSKNMR